MQITIDQLLQKVGFLTIENEVLKQTIEHLQQQLKEKEAEKEDN